MAGLGLRKRNGAWFRAVITVRQQIDVRALALQETGARASMASVVSMIKNSRSRPLARSLATSMALLAAVCFLVSSASSARADRCDDLAAQLKNQIDGLTVGKTAANVITMSHPQAEQVSLGCSGRSFSNQWFAKARSRKPPAAFLDLVASGGAIIFTMPKSDMLRGATRCIKRMGLLHGDDVSIRFRRLDMHCVRTKTEASISISRGTDE
jgi:hypothetical protein